MSILNNICNYGRRRANLLTLGLMLAVAVIAGSCSNKQKAEEEARLEEERIAAEQIAKEQALKNEKEEFRKTKYAQFSEAHGYNSTMMWGARNKVQDFEYEISDIENLGQKDIMLGKMEAAAASISGKYMKILNDKLSAYGVSCERRDYGQGNAETIDLEDVNTEMPYPVDWHLDIVMLGLDKYGEPRKKEIRDIARKQIEAMIAEIKRACAGIEKDYYVYYPALNLNAIPKQHREMVYKYCTQGGEGSFYYEGQFYPKLIQVIKGVSVYDSKLSVDFFNDKNAKYKLLDLGNGKWQVQKTDKSGKVSKTHVFEDNKEWSTWVRIYNKDDLSENNIAVDGFSFSPGANLGVRVSMNQVVWTSARGKDDRYPDPNGINKAKIKNLNDSILYYNDVYENQRIIQNMVDSLTCDAVQKEYN
ncbi:MAG: hypothetical protein FWE50_04915 [Alphaproteobacteria bacterium]|nr:hypothetical protein [Alphaproteobacteria bacterium]